MKTQGIIGSKALNEALKHSGAQSSWKYRAAVPSKKAIEGMEKRVSESKKVKQGLK